jgi:hypothetical protein
VRGIEAESVLTFAGLLAIAQPLRGYVRAVPAGQAPPRQTRWAGGSATAATGFWSVRRR